MADLVRMEDQFSGLDMSALIGGPLRTACKAQTMLAQSQLNFIKEVGLYEEENKKTIVRTASFSFTRSTAGESEGNGATKGYEEQVEMNVPVLALVNVPSLAIDKVNITFDMEVKSSTSSQSTSDKSLGADVGGSGKFGFFKFNVSIKGSVSSHEKNTRTSDNSAKYHVGVYASQQPTPEGLSRVLDILNTAIAPTNIEKKEKTTEPKG